jgi:Uncharacterized conserved protein
VKIGLIGAGKVGTSLGKYLTTKDFVLSGFFDTDAIAAEKAATKTNSCKCASIQQLISNSDLVFLTVKDDNIASLALVCAEESVSGKTFCHCSGALSSKVMQPLRQKGAWACSAHPLCAVSGFDDAQIFSNKTFTLEGDEQGLKMLQSLFSQTHNPFCIISSADKAKYHAAAVFASNFVCSLADISNSLFFECGFEPEQIGKMLWPLLEGNAHRIVHEGALSALTGPIERNDVLTVKNHLGALRDENLKIYLLLSRHLLIMAEKNIPIGTTMPCVDC